MDTGPAYATVVNTVTDSDADPSTEVALAMGTGADMAMYTATKAAATMNSCISEVSFMSEILAQRMNIKYRMT